MDELFSRNILYWGEDFQESLTSKNIFVFGLGGVGGFALEALARVGIEKFTIVDFDIVSKSNINRQIIALNSTIGQKKTTLFQKRLLDINKNINVKVIDDFYNKENAEEIFNMKPDFIIDAIDTLSAKIHLIKYAKENNFNIISSFGTGNRIDCSKLKVGDISVVKSNDSFVKNILSKLKKENINFDLPVVWSEEKAYNLKKIKNIEKIKTKTTEIELAKFSPASISTVPAVCGYLMANYVINYFYKNYIPSAFSSS